MSTPLFQQPFDENTFKPILRLTLDINVPESIQKSSNMSIVIDVEYDLAEFSDNEYVTIVGHELRLEKTEKRAERVYISLC